MKVGFLFNHEGGHQVAHGLPIALYLSRLRADFDVRIFYAGNSVRAEVQRLSADVEHRCTMTELSMHSALGRIATRVVGANAPVARVALLRDNLDRYRELDALVVPEKTSLLLKTRFGLDKLKMIHTRHGAGDRAIGFDKASGLFDFVLVSGPKIRDRLMQAGLIGEGDYAIVGYPKFDTLAEAPSRPRYFDNGRPTVLYNPHPSPRLSSWYKMGQQILAFFSRSPDYNLIFAPHLMLFKKNWTVSLDPPAIAHTGHVPAIYRSRPNMLIDTGSRASVDMSYTRAADIYLGDASSQVYEFLAEPRPCLFANPHHWKWQGDPNFAHWNAGPVFDGIEELPGALERAVREQDHYLPIQRDMFARTFDLGERPSSERAALAIAAYLDSSGS